MSNANWGGIQTVPENMTNWATTTREPNNDLDRNAFLNLLITQLRHQDPLNPMDDRDFIAQMAQFSALEQMMQLNATFERTQAFSMIGKRVDATFPCPTTGERIEIEHGLVVSVSRQGQNVFLGVLGENGRTIDVPFDAVREVSEDFFLDQALSEIFGQVQGQRATDLLGQYVQGFARFGDSFEFVEGKVHSISMEGNIAVLHVGNRDLRFPADVFSVVTSERKLIGSEAFTHGGTNGYLAGVDVVNRSGQNPRLYLQFSNGDRIHVNNLSHVMSALNYVNERITSGTVTNGLVESVTITGGIPFLNARDEEGELRQIDFLAYIAHRTGAEVPESDDEAGGTGGGNP